MVASLNTIHKNVKGVDVDALWAKITNYLSSFDPRQIRYLGEEFNYIIRSVAELARSNNQVCLASIVSIS